MRTITILLALLIATAPCCAQCAPPERAVQKLAARFSYENSLGTNTTLIEHFTVLKLDRWTFLRHDNPSPYFAPGVRPVYVVKGSQLLGNINCPAGPAWLACAEDEMREQHEVPTTKEQTCEFTLTVPPWHPSPESPEKREMARTLLREIRSFGASPNDTIYVRNFNLNDPEIDFWIVHRHGEPEPQGCAFDRTKSPHCSWHMYGTVSLESLRQNVMSRPYRLYPSPMGPVPKRAAPSAKR